MKDNDGTVIERENKLNAVLARFRSCDAFEQTSPAHTRFEAVREQVHGDVYVGLACKGNAGPLR